MLMTRLLVAFAISVAGLLSIGLCHSPADSARGLSSTRHRALMAGQARSHQRGDQRLLEYLARHRRNHIAVLRELLDNGIAEGLFPTYDEGSPLTAFD